MARTSNTPHIGYDEPLLIKLLRFVVGFPLMMWATWQVIWMGLAFVGWLIGQDASTFMYSPYQEWWERWKYDVMPSWFFYLPTWRDWWTYAIIAAVVLGIRRMTGQFGLPWKRETYTPMYDKDDFGFDGEDAPRRSRPGASDSWFDPSAFGKGKGQNEKRILDPSRLLEAFKPRDETEAAAQRKADDPATNEAERQNIYKILHKRRQSKGGKKQ